MEEKPKVKTSPDEAPTRATTATLTDKQQTTPSGLRTGIQGDQFFFRKEIHLLF